jgi:tRNA threonylcarbamoyladenosine biosynthesis protein TsaB
MILAMDTATRAISIALHDGQRITAERMWRTQGHHTVELTTALADMLAQVGVSTGDLTALAVPKGPGSYTGLRIGMSVAKGIALAQAQPLPLIGVPTLNILAAAQPRVTGRLCVATQAGRRRINAGFYRWSVGGWRAEGDPFITTWGELADELSREVQVAGEIDATGWEALTALGEGVTMLAPAFGVRRAAFLAELAYGRYRSGDVDDAATLAPIYLS